MTTDIHAATQAIRDALAAVPTVGPWQIIKSYGSGARCSIKAGHARIAVPSVTNLNWEANAALIAACNPEAITTILAALEARDAEIAALREDAERYRWLRQAACFSILEGIFDIESSRHPSAELDAAIDQALTPQHPRFPWTEPQKIARQIRGDGGKERKG